MVTISSSQIKCLVVGSMLSSISSLSIAEEYGSNTVFQGTWGRPEPTAQQKVLGAPSLTKAEEITLGYFPEEKEPGPNDFQEPASGPRDFDIDKEGNFYIADDLKQRIVKFDKQGRYILSIEKSSDGTPYFRQPKNIAIDNQGNVYVKDLEEDRCIFMFDSSGNFLQKITSIGSYNADQIKWITGLDPDNRGNIFIRVEIEGRDDMNFKLGNGGKVLEEFEGPFYWRRDGNGRTYKTSPEADFNSCTEPIQIVNLGGKIEKEILVDFGTGTLNEYKPIGVDDDGNIYYYEWQKMYADEIWKFNNDGKLVQKIKVRPDNTLGMENEGFKILPDGTIYQMHAADEGLRIIKYEPDKTQAESPSKDETKKEK